MHSIGSVLFYFFIKSNYFMSTKIFNSFTSLATLSLGFHSLKNPLQFSVNVVMLQDNWKLL